MFPTCEHDRRDQAGFTGYHLAEHHGSDLCLATFDRLALDDEQAEAALNPLAHRAVALMEADGDAALPELTADSGTPAHVRER